MKRCVRNTNVSRETFAKNAKIETRRSEVEIEKKWYIQYCNSIFGLNMYMQNKKMLGEIEDVSRETSNLNGEASNIWVLVQMQNSKLYTDWGGA